MSSSDKRRLSDQGVVRQAMQLNDNGSRRKTIGSGESNIPIDFTPSKQKQVQLGHAGQYYFGSAKKHTPSRKTPKKTPQKEITAEDQVNPMETSFLSLGASSTSSDDSDLMNKSVLSDTTELTASNFVLAATSRQKLLELSNKVDDTTGQQQEEENGVTSSAKKSIDTPDTMNQREPFKAVNRDASPNPTLAASPSTRSLMSTTTPESIRKLTDSLRKQRLMNEERRRASMGLDKNTDRHKSTSSRYSLGGKNPIMTRRDSISTIGGVPSLPSPALSIKSKQSPAAASVASSTSTATEASAASSENFASQEDIDDLLTGMGGGDKSKLEDSLLVTPKSAEASNLESDDDATTVNSAKPKKSPSSRLTPTRLSSSPGRVPMDEAQMEEEEEDEFFDTDKMEQNDGEAMNDSSPPPEDQQEEAQTQQTPPSGQKKKLTPTKLSASPRRVLNPASLDSPARRTRSATKEPGSNKRERDGGEEQIVGTSKSAKVGRRPSEVAITDNTRRLSDVTAATTDFNAIFGSGIKSLSSPGLPRRSSRKSIMSSPGLPRGILNSTTKKKRRMTLDSSRKSVAFGSPEVVEYHVGSPSVSMTPMEPGMAKARYAIPSDKSTTPTGEDAVVNQAEDQTAGGGEMKELFGGAEGADEEVSRDVEMEHAGNKDSADEEMEDTREPPIETENYDMDVTESSTLSASSSILSKTDDATEELESNLSSLLNNTYDKPITEPSTQMESSVLSTESSTASSVATPGEDATVGLESNLLGLLETVDDEQGSVAPKLKDTLQSKDSPLAESHKTAASSPADSVDMADAMSIMSANRNVVSQSTEQDSAKDSVQKLQFAEKSSEKTLSPMSDASGMNIDTTMEEDNTVELEADMSALLAVASQGSDAGDSGDLPSVRLSEKFPKMTSNLVSEPSNRMSFGESNKLEEGSVQEPVETAELEDNVQPLLQATATEKVGPVRDEVTETVELEDNVESLFQNTAGRENTPTGSRVGMDSDEAMYLDLCDTPQTSGNPRRRSSMSASSRRFSLAAPSHVSLNDDGSVLVDSPDRDFEEVTQQTQVQDLAEVEEELVLTNTHIDDIAELQDLRIEHALDTTVYSKAVAEDSKNHLISEAMAGFALAVCGEIEGKAEVSSDSKACFDDLVEQMDQDIFQLQESLQTEDGREEVKGLADAVAKFVDHEWKSWESMVAESLISTVERIPEEFTEDDNNVDRCTTLVEDTHEALSLVSGKALQKARRKSMHRRKAASTVLEEEIGSMEKELAEARHKLASVQADLDSVNVLSVVTKDGTSVREEVHLASATAERRQGKYTSVKGLSSMVPLAVEESKVSVAFVGPSPLSCFSVTFDFVKGGSVQCSAFLASSHFKRRTGKRANFTPSSIAFLKSRISAMVEGVSKQILQSPSEIGLLLQRLEWTKGRIESTAFELTTLQRRYDAFVEADPQGGKSDFLIHLKFTGSKSGKKLDAVFELDASYPFGPLNVSLDSVECSESEMNMLRRQLIKNAKPGFGYMSRAVDVISAFVR